MNNPRLQILFALFVGLLIGMNLLGSKITTLFDFSVSVGIFMMPITFLITDIVEEVYGKNIVKNFIFNGILILVITFLYTIVFVKLSPHQKYQYNDEYQIIFGNSLRMIFASIIAFFLSQINDVVTFEFLKKKTKGKLLWLRNNLSTISSQFIDTFVFMMIAFLYTNPKFNFSFVFFQMTIPYYLFKVAFAIIDTPFIYLGIKWLKNGEK